MPFFTSARAQNYPGWDEGWLTVVRQRIQIEDEVVEDIADLGLDGVEAESQVIRLFRQRRDAHPRRDPGGSVHTHLRIVAGFVFCFDQRCVGC